MLSLLLALLTFFGAKRKGASTAGAAMMAAGVGLASWNTIDPQNPNRLFFKPTQEDKGKVPPGKKVQFDTGTGTPFYTDENGERVNVGSTDKDSDPSPVWEFSTNAVDKIGDVATSWGPTGTIGAIVAGSNTGTIKAAIKGVPTWVWSSLLVVGGFLLIKKAVR